MLRPVLIGSIIGSCVGIVPGTGASEASWFSYNTAKTCLSTQKNLVMVLWKAWRLPNPPTTPSAVRP